MVLNRQSLKEESGSYTPRLVAVFYAVFDPTVGPRVVHQIPEGSVATALSTIPSRSETPANELRASLSPASTASRGVDVTDDAAPRANPVLFDFASIIDFVIPKPELCGHLITKATRTSKILGFPIRIVDEEKYHGSQAVYNRNAFIFNLCFVFERDAELSVFEPVVRKTGRTLREMEEQSSLLSSPPPTFSMANLLEQLYLDLNAYCETSIPLVDTDLVLGLFPFYANPPDVKIWDVPLAVANIEQLKSYSWDVTLFKICSFIDGVNHVKRIAELAEVDLYLARQCIQHLVYYNAVIIVDIFQFSNSYAVLPDIADVAQYGEEDDEGVTDLRTECENYVFNGSRDATPVPFATLLTYYSRLRSGLAVSDWMDDLSLDTQPIDVRRMIQFGVIKGFLRRVHAFPVWLDHPTLRPRSAISETAGTAASAGANRTRRHRGSNTSAKRRLETSLDGAQPPRDAPARPQHSTLAQPASEPAALPEDDDATGPLVTYPHSLTLMFDGSHHTDEICLKYSCSWRTLEMVLRDLGSKGGRGEELESEEDEERFTDGKRRGSTGAGQEGVYGERVVMMFV
ncbi:Nitrogen permease regulator 2 [Rhodotorula toruloides]|nr:Nitrogen permease regulator 2 [Rhodotorula toruloides]